MNARTLIVGMCVLLPLAGQPRRSYSVTDIGPAGGTFGSAFAINDPGDAAGRWQPAPHTSRAFAWIGGVSVDIGPLPGKSFSRAQGINNRGEVVGFSWASPDESDSHVFLWDRGVLTDMHPVVSLGGSASFVGGINTAGHIAGDSLTSGDAEDHAFLYRNGRSMDLGTLGGTVSFADAVSNGDDAVGSSSLSGDAVFHAFLWRGRMIDLGGLGGNYAEAVAISESGLAVGYGLLPGDSVQHAFFYNRHSLTDIHTSALPADSLALGINNRGQIVGLASSNINDVFASNFAVLWDGGAVFDLNTLIPPGSGWQLYRAAAINERGEIVGVGNHNGQIRAFLLKPAP